MLFCAQLVLARGRYMAFTRTDCNGEQSLKNKFGQLVLVSCTRELAVAGSEHIVVRRY